MKKNWLLVCICLYALCLTGCIDIVQHITRQTDGTERIIICVTIPKVLIEKIAEMHDLPADSDAIADMLAEGNMSDYDQFSATTAQINNEASIGWLVDMNIDYKDEHTQKAINECSIDFIPKYEKGKMILYFKPSTSGLTDGYMENEELEVLLTIGKYRLFVSKTSMPSLSKVVVKTEEKPTDIGYLDLYDQYLIEIPIKFLFSGKIRSIELYR